jgi:hypothetical protein
VVGHLEQNQEVIKKFTMVVDTKLHRTCKFVCQTPKFKQEYTTTTKNKNAYRNGFFRCRKCEYYIKDFTYCPCCGTKLAIAPRNAKSKRELTKDIVRY